MSLSLLQWKINHKEQHNRIHLLAPLTHAFAYIISHQVLNISGIHPPFSLPTSLCQPLPAMAFYPVYLPPISLLYFSMFSTFLSSDLPKTVAYIILFPYENPLLDPFWLEDKVQNFRTTWENIICPLHMVPVSVPWCFHTDHSLRSYQTVC